VFPFRAVPHVSGPVAVELFDALGDDDVLALSSALERLEAEVRADPARLASTPSVRDLLRRIKDHAERRIEMKDGALGAGAAMGGIGSAAGFAIAAVLAARSTLLAVEVILLAALFGIACVFFGARFARGKKQWENVVASVDRINAIPLPPSPPPAAGVRYRVALPGAAVVPEAEDAQVEGEPSTKRRGTR
jgi:hypothetical protein